MKILIIDNNIDLAFWGSKDIRRLANLGAEANIYTRRGPQGDLPPDPGPFDRIIVSGSRTSSLEDAPWIDQLLKFIQKAVEMKKPYLGVCYGHQVLARALGGKESLRKASQPEFGWTQIRITGDSPLLEGLPQSFYSFSAHFEEVYQLSKGMKNLASSSACHVQACQLENLPIFGIQFHPEKELPAVAHIFQEVEHKGTLLMNADRSEELYDPRVGETLFKNFLNL